MKPTVRPAKVCLLAATISALYALPASADALSDLQAQLNAIKAANEQQMTVLNEQIMLLKAAQAQTKAVLQKEADKPAMKGDMPGSIKIPGTKTSLKLSGFVKADYSHDLGHFTDDFVPGWRFSVDPGDTQLKGATRFYALQSQIGFETQTPTPLGLLKTNIRGDFWGDNHPDERGTMNAAFWRIRLAYAELGSWTMGQLTTNFFHGPSFPDTLDVNSPTGQALLRQAQLRYTTKVASNATLSVAAEDPFTDVAGTTAKGLSDKLPDFTGRLVVTGDWGNMSVQSVLRSLNNDRRGAPAGTPGAGTYKSTLGYGIGVAGNIKTGGKDDLRFQLNVGDGMGRYSQAAIFMAAGVDPVTGEFVTVKTYGGFVAYRHFWADDLRSTVAVGYARMKNEAKYVNSINFGGPTWGTLPGVSGASNVLQSFHTNLIWTPVKDVDIGVEYMRGYRERTVTSLAGGLTGTFQRLQMSGKYSF